MLAAGISLALAVAVALGVMAILGFDFDYGPGVAVLDVYGELLDAQVILDELDGLVGDPSTQALVVRVDSPGGDVAVVEEVYNAIKRVRDDGLPVVASMGSTAASGGYYISCAAERIFANKCTLTGSLGVLLEYPNATELLNAIGVHFETITTGEFKNTGAWDKPLTDAQRAQMQAVIDDYHAMFVELVSSERPLDFETVRTLADGRVFTGRQAVELKLVDDIGDLDDAVHFAAGLAGIEGEPRVIRYEEKSLSWLGWLEELDVAGTRLRNHWAPKFVLR
jgi:protease-4